MDHGDDLARALRLHRAGDAQAAILACREAARDENPVAARLLGLLLAETGHLEEARRWVRIAVARDRSAETLTAEGRVLAMAGEWIAAATALREALRMRPGFPAASQLLDRAEAAAAGWLRDADALFAAGRFVEAAALFKDASLVRPGDAAILHALGTALHESGNPEAAINAYRDALAVAPRRIETWHNLGSALQAIGDVEAALDAYARAYAIDPASFPRIAQELAAGRAGQVWLSAAALKARLALSARDRDTGRDTARAQPAQPLPPR
jgi:tetratricopeptide (TPR) repeat protein